MRIIELGKESKPKYAYKSEKLNNKELSFKINNKLKSILGSIYKFRAGSFEKIHNIKWQE